MEPFILSKHIVSVIPDFLCHLSNVLSFYMYDHHLFPVILAKARSQRAVLFQPWWSQRKHFANALLILGIHLQFLLCIFTHVHGYLFFCRVKVVGRRSGLSCDQPWRASKRQPVVRNGTNNNQAMSSLKCWLKLKWKKVLKHCPCSVVSCIVTSALQGCDGVGINSLYTPGNLKLFLKTVSCCPIITLML